MFLRAFFLLILSAASFTFSVQANGTTSQKCRHSLVSDELKTHQESFPWIRVVDAFVEALAPQYENEKNLAQSKRFWITPLPQERISFINGGHATDGYFISVDYKNRRYPLALIYRERKNSLYVSITPLTQKSPDTHLNDLNDSIGGILRRIIDEEKEPLLIKFSRTSIDDIRIDKRFDLSWTTQHPVTKETRPADLYLFPKIFSPGSIYSKNLLSTVVPKIKTQNKILVLGTGSGVDALRIATQIPIKNPIIAVDINPIAVANTKLNAEFWQVSDHIQTAVSDGFSNVQGTYDTIIFDAPLAFEGPQESEGSYSNLHDFNGVLLKRILKDLPSFLTIHGSFYLMSAKDISKYIAENPKLKSRLLHTFSEGTGEDIFHFGIHEITLK